MNAETKASAPLTTMVALLSTLEDTLREANARASQASDLMRRGARNEAIGAVLELDALLTDSHALYGAVTSLHRTAPRTQADVPSAARLLIEAIQTTDGLITNPDGTCGPRADPEWIDIADAYFVACAELGVAPLLQNDTEAASAPAPELHPISKMTFADMSRRFPTGQIWHTGGGCHAWRLECDPGSYLLVTACDSDQPPADDALEVHAGRYAASGDPLGDVSAVSAEELPEWIHGMMQRAAHPQNVGDYFVQKLGEDHHDETLYDLLLVSNVGEDCVAAIEAAALLIAHMRKTVGVHGQIVPGSTEVRRTPESDIVAAVRQIVGVYWRG